MRYYKKKKKLLHATRKFVTNINDFACFFFFFGKMVRYIILQQNKQSVNMQFL